MSLIPRSSVPRIAGKPLRAALLLSSALVAAVSLPAVAQSVVISGDVNPSPAGTPDWNVGTPLYIGEFDDGTLSVSGGGAVINTDGYINYDGDSYSTATVTGAGSSWTNSGDLVVGRSGEGRLSVSAGGAVTNEGGTIGESEASIGAVTVTGSGSSWTNIGDFAVGYFGDGTLTIADGGVVSANAGAGIAYIASIGGSTGTLNIGAAPGDAAVAPGTLQAAEVRFGNGGGTLNFNHTSTNYVFAPSITGSGVIDHHAGTTVLTGNSSNFTGITTVSGGVMRVNGTLGGTLSVLADGTLGGSGTVGTTTVGSGGTISPGNSIGTLAVIGDITFAPGSVYAVEVDPAGAGSDLIAATGTAFLQGGSVVQIGVNGTYSPTATYTILTAAGGITGAFDTVSSNFAFLDPTLDYGANAVTLTLKRNAVTFVDLGWTRNQRATAGGLDSLASGNAVHDAVVQLDGPTARFAFDQLSGEIHGSARTALIEDSRHIRDAVLDRLRAAFDGVGASSTPILAYGPGGPVVALPDTDDFAAWGQVFGSFGATDSDGNAARLERNTGGFLIGADGLIDTWRLGLLAGYSHSSFDAAARASSGESDNVHLGLYGGTRWGALGVRGGAAYTWHHLKTSRSPAFTGFTDGLTAGYDAGTAQVFGEAGYTIDAGRIAFEPFAGLAYINLATAGFTESGGAGALTGNGGSTGATFSTLGVRVASDFMIGDMVATARGMLGWRHGFGDVTPTSTLAFQGGQAFTVAGVPLAADSAVIEAGFDLNLTDNATLGISYSGQFGSGAQDHSAKASFSFKL